MPKTIRWKQRFENFQNSYKLLERTINIKNPSEAESGGLIQFFEITFELSWKTLKDYLESEGYILKSPRETLKQAFQDEIITNGHVWLEALEKRNLTTHIYNEKISKEIETSIREIYFPEIKKLYNFFDKKYHE